MKSAAYAATTVINCCCGMFFNVVKKRGGSMTNGKFIAYYRVNTQKQGQAGLGFEAQQVARKFAGK